VNYRHVAIDPSLDERLPWTMLGEFLPPGIRARGTVIRLPAEGCEESTVLTLSCLLAAAVGLSPLPPPMHFSPAWLAAHQARRAAMPATVVNSDQAHQVARGIAAGAANQIDLLPLLAYTPATWNQGSCADCWVWGSTAAASIRMAALGVHDLMSVQYMNSGYEDGTGEWACCGVDASMFASWYATQHRFVPAGNPGAAYADASATCSGATAEPFAHIQATPDHPFSRIHATRVPTTRVTQAQAILNIKSLLSQNRPLTLLYFLPGAGWEDFDVFWLHDAAQTSWTDVDKYSGTAWDDLAGGHLVCVAGYDDQDHTWICLNCWSTTAQRPLGTFRIPQAMGYGDWMTCEGQPMDQYEFDCYDLSLPPTSRRVSGGILAPADGSQVASGQSLAFLGAGGDTDPGGTLSYAWSFGDGGTAYGPSASHTYVNATASPLEEEVVLTVSDASGAQGKASLQVTVAPAS
jgi:hypothetical protein